MAPLFVIVEVLFILSAIGHLLHPISTMDPSTGVVCSVLACWAALRAIDASRRESER